MLTMIAFLQKGFQQCQGHNVPYNAAAHSYSSGCRMLDGRMFDSISRKKYSFLLLMLGQLALARAIGFRPIRNK